MLSQNLRPQDWDSVAGQKIIKETMKAIIRQKDTAPRSIILSGGFGCGKTTSSRIFAKALNCPNVDSKGNPCNKPDCPICSQNLEECSFYTEYDASIVGNVEKIRELRDTFYYTTDGIYKVIVLDECFKYDTPILVKDGEKTKYVDIGTIVNKGLPYEVACVDSQGNLQFKPIVGWHRIKSNKRQLKLTFKRLKSELGGELTKSIVCTENHKLSIGDNIYKCAKDLKIGDKVKGYLKTSDIAGLYSVSRKHSTYEVNEEVYQMMLGIAIGNSCLQRSLTIDEKRDREYLGNARFSVNNSEKESLYLKHLYNLFGDLKGNYYENNLTEDELEYNRTHRNIYSSNNIHGFNTKSNKIFTEIYDMTRESSSQKIISDEWLNKISPLGLSYLYSDIGSYHRNRCQLSLHNFYKKDVLKLKDYFLEKWGINFSYYKDVRVFNGIYKDDDSDLSKGYTLITSSFDDTTMFLSLVAPFIHKSMEFKLGGIFKAGDSCSLTTPIEYKKKLVPNFRLTDYELVSIEEHKGSDIVYDLTIQDNHNYFANNILAHNCQEASKAAQGALLKVLEEAPKGVFFVFATTHPHKLLPTIISRSLQIKVTTVPQSEIIKNIKSNCEALGLEADDLVVNTIANRSKGHMRNAHMLLDLYQLVGRDVFAESVKSSRQILMQYFLSIVNKNKAMVLKSVGDLQAFPVSDIKSDLDQLLLDMTKYLIESDDTPLCKLSKALGMNLLKIVKQVSTEWFRSSFYDDISMQTALLALWQMSTASIVDKTKAQVRTK